MFIDRVWVHVCVSQWSGWVPHVDEEAEGHSGALSVTHHVLWLSGLGLAEACAVSTTPALGLCVCHHTWLFVFGSNSGPCICTAGILPTEYLPA